MTDRPLLSLTPVEHTCPRPVRLNVLTRAPYFAGLAEEQIEYLDSLMHVRSYSVGEAIYHSGQDATRLFVVASGRIKLLRPSASGQDTLIDVMVPGGMFGTLSELGDPAYRDSAVALTPVCVLSMSDADFHTVLRAHPSVALAALADVAQRLAHSQETVRAMAADTVAQRVAGRLVQLADKVGVAHEDGTIRLEVPLTRADLAAMVGSTTESVSRVMSRLRADGLVTSGRGWTSVRDLDALRDRASSPE